MVSSSLADNIVWHQFEGALNLRDLMQARQYVEHNVQPGPHCAVLWDFRRAILEFTDDRYSVLSQAVVNQATDTASSKRAFLVGSAPHLKRVQGVLASVTLPWPWAVFEDEQAAFAWLRS